MAMYNIHVISLRTFMNLKSKKISNIFTMPIRQWFCSYSLGKGDHINIVYVKSHVTKNEEYTNTFALIFFTCKIYSMYVFREKFSIHCRQHEKRQKLQSQFLLTCLVHVPYPCIELYFSIYSFRSFFTY